MFDIGFWELCIIGIVSLLVIGPERLPGVARTIGRWVAKAQRLVNSVKSEINRELEASELRDMIGEQKKQIEELQGFVKEARQEFVSTTHQAMDEGQKTLNEGVESTRASLEDAKSAFEDSEAPTENSIMPPDTSNQDTQKNKADEKDRKSA